jgi:hypothetical protein
MDTAAGSAKDNIGAASQRTGKALQGLNPESQPLFKAFNPECY